MDGVWVQLYVDDEKEGDVAKVVPTEFESGFIDSIVTIVQQSYPALDLVCFSELEVYPFLDSTKVTEVGMALSSSDVWNPSLHGGDESNRPLVVKVDTSKGMKRASDLRRAHGFLSSECVPTIVSHGLPVFVALDSVALR